MTYQDSSPASRLSPIQYYLGLILIQLVKGQLRWCNRWCYPTKPNNK